MLKRLPSKLGKTIALAITSVPGVRPYSDDHEKSYALLFKTERGLPFAVERVT